MELNSLRAQIEELKNVTSKGFSKLMYMHTRIVATEELDSLLNEAMELEEQGNSVSYLFDENYSSIAADYVLLDSNDIKERFGRLGNAYLYMDKLGRGLVVFYH